jgi:rubrerythrin
MPLQFGPINENNWHKGCSIFLFQGFNEKRYVMVMMEATKTKGHSQYFGINQVTVADGEDGIFSAFIELAFQHTQNDSMVYEYAALHSTNPTQKILFIQLACRKIEVLNKLKMQRSDSALLRSAQQSHNGYSLSWYLKEIESAPLITMEDSMKFAIQRECRTFALYKKLEKIMLYDSTKALFEYLVNSQYALMEYLSLKHSTEIALHG